MKWEIKGQPLGGRYYPFRPSRMDQVTDLVPWRLDRGYSNDSLDIDAHDVHDWVRTGAILLSIGIGRWLEKPPPNPQEELGRAAGPSARGNDPASVAPERCLPNQKSTVGRDSR